MRTFIAVPLPESTRRLVAEILAELQRADASTEGEHARLVTPDMLHVTLQFLGKTSEAQQAALQSSLPGLAAASPRLSLRLEQSGTFGGRALMLWLGVGGDLVGLRALRGSMVPMLTALGFKSEERPYVPHLTVARLSTGQSGPPARALAERMEASNIPFTAEEVVLFRSDTLPEGARYTPLLRSKLS